MICIIQVQNRFTHVHTVFTLHDDSLTLCDHFALRKQWNVFPDALFISKWRETSTKMVEESSKVFGPEIATFI